ncbi:MAG: hypothetical protein HZB25_06720 [Candidatus Eisenbacteria bacterium]|nr:hypothetical protein [Candidatus Eisenbacteria bacterium]
MNSIYYPVFLDLLGARVVVVGSAHGAGDLVESLLHAGARVTLVAPQAEERLRRAGEEARLRWVPREYRLEDLEEAALVFAMDADPAQQHRVCEDARDLGLWVNRADEPLDSTFLVPRVFERGPLQVALHADRSTPALDHAALVAVAEALGHEFGVLAEWLAEPRSGVALRIPGEEFRHELAEQVMKSEVPGLLRQGRHGPARERFEEVRSRCEASWALPK